jgi:hypothetical protein
VRSKGGSGEAVAGSEEWASHRCVPRGNSPVLLFRSSPVNLGSRASYRHGVRDPLPMDLVVTPLFKALTDLWRETQTRFDRSRLRSIQHDQVLKLFRYWCKFPRRRPDSCLRGSVSISNSPLIICRMTICSLSLYHKHGHWKSCISNDST